MTINQVSIVLVGAGLIGPRHAQHVIQRQDTILFAIIDPFSGEDLAEKLNVPLYKSVEEMISKSSSKPDAAIVATPNHTHVSIALELASHGIHLLVEKPLSSKPEDSKALYEYTEKNNIKLLVGHHRRFNPYILATKKNLTKLGKIVAIQGTWCLKKPQSYFDIGKWRTDSKTGGGTLLINLIHDVDLLICLFGPIEKVYAELLMKQRENNCDEGASLTLRFSNGIVGTFICSDNVVSSLNFESGTGENPTIPHDQNSSGIYRIFGSDGTLSFPDLNLYHQNNFAEKSWNNPVTMERLVSSKDLNGVPFDLQLEHFVRVVNGLDEPSCTAIDGIMAVNTVDAVMRSIESGLPTKVKTFDELESSLDSLSLSN